MRHALHTWEFETLDGIEVEGSEDRGFHSYGTFVTEGDTLDELMANGSVFTVDQDGGEGWEVMFDDLPATLQTRLTDAMLDKWKRDVEDYDPTPWCSACGAMTRARCDCGPIMDGSKEMAEAYAEDAKREHQAEQDREASELNERNKR